MLFFQCLLFPDLVFIICFTCSVGSGGTSYDVLGVFVFDATTATTLTTYY